MDYRDPIKSVYTVPYTTARRFSIMLSCMCAAYVLGAGPSVLVKDFAAIPFNTVACIWIGPLASFSTLYIFCAFIYVIFTEKRLLPVVLTSMILVYCHCPKLNWWPGTFGTNWWGGTFWTFVLILAGLFLLYRLLRNIHGS